MSRSLFLFPIIASLAMPVMAQDNAVIEGLPAGVLVYDAGEAGSAVPPTVVAPPEAAAPPVATQSPASTRSAAPVTLPGVAVVSGAVLAPSVGTATVDLVPGEQVLQVIAAPSIINVPESQPIYTMTSEAEVTQRTRPQPKVDPFSGKLRDTPGWTGNRAAPASIGCFPAGACAVLNQR